jgi:hypothetical protein
VFEVQRKWPGYIHSNYVSIGFSDSGSDHIEDDYSSNTPETA